MHMSQYVDEFIDAVLLLKYLHTTSCYFEGIEEEFAFEVFHFGLLLYVQ